MEKNSLQLLAKNALYEGESIRLIIVLPVGTHNKIVILICDSCCNIASLKQVECMDIILKVLMQVFADFKQFLLNTSHFS